METLIGMTMEQWLRVLKENQFRIHPFKIPLVLMMTGMAIRNSYYAKKERYRYQEDIQKVSIKQPPIFILGHWRSGTTLLRNLLAQDSQFAYPTLLEIYNPAAFLTLEKKIEHSHALQRKWKRPMDNVKVSLLSPGEEEFAIGMLSGRTPLLAWSFPQHTAYYDRYLTFKTAEAWEIEEWRNAYEYFLKKLTYRYQKPLILKSPPNTARIRLLHQLFPEARFIHIHRNPFRVFQSTVKLYQAAANRFSLQRPLPSNQMMEGILQRYQTMYAAYWEDVADLPPHLIIDVAFEDLVKDFVGTIQEIYQHLNLDGFAAFKPRLEKAVQQMKNYQTNQYEPLSEEYQRVIKERWGRYYQPWGYANSA